MGKMKKKARKARSGVDAAHAASVVQAEIAAAEEPRSAAPPAVGRLTSNDPSIRRVACLDIASQSLVDANVPLLISSGALPRLKACIVDNNWDVQTAALGAVRNLCKTAGDTFIDQVCDNETLQNLLGVANAACGRVVLQEGAGAAQSGEEMTLRKLHQSLLDECIQLATVLAEANDKAAQYLSATTGDPNTPPVFPSILVNSLQWDGTRVAAAECLRILSEDNEPMAAFVTHGLTPPQQELLNSFIAAPQVSPSLQLVSVQLCGALLNCAPNVHSLTKVLAIVVPAIAVSPRDSIKKLIPLIMADDSSLDATVRDKGIEQGLDRLRALQCALDIASNLISIVCEAHDDSLEDEAAFAQNPSAALLDSSGLVSAVLRSTNEILSPMEDLVLQRSLFDDQTSNGDVHTLRFLYYSVEVGILGVASSLSTLLPAEALGDLNSLWRMCLNALHQRLTARKFDFHSRGLLQLQLESIVHIAWALIRKESARGREQIQKTPDDLQLLTQYCSDQKHTTTAGRVGVLGIVSCVGLQAHADNTVNFACGEFCRNMLQSEDPEVVAEAANTIIDLYSDENFDANYVSLGLQRSMRSVIAPLTGYMKQFKKRSPEREHISEVVQNLEPFLQYKQQHIPES